MHPNRGILEVTGEGGKILDGEGIDQNGLLSGGKLDETEGFLMAVEAVGLGVDRAHLLPCYVFTASEKLFELGGGTDHEIGQLGARRDKEWDGGLQRKYEVRLIFI
jgi:hypothetical protein